MYIENFDRRFAQHTQEIEKKKKIVKISNYFPNKIRKNQKKVIKL